ncbi:CoA ester lyase [Novosphingobium sp. 1949]|uniref:CoA ester lyase n=1 Tax=Novosphingobium organovorum TaxID=2930092 RepID=A0ABT0BGF5_9SPHN|nr:CoA ester lyase [Novosphingobium organovorum]MCJ2184114.1 CoA ester lyase [Novosphingobium organovorum]
MKSRSWLIVPGNSDKRLGLAIGTGADIVVVDLEDTVPVSEKPRARHLAAEWLAAHRQQVLEQPRLGRWVRINALEAGLSREDLAAVMPLAPDGLILPKSCGPDSVRQLASEVYECEQAYGIAPNSTRIVPVVGENPRAALRIADYAQSAHQRLSALTWNAAGLCAAMGRSGNRTADGGWPDAARYVRAQALLSAHAGDVMAIDAPHEDFEDEEGVRRAAQAACADGFAGMMAIHPGQVAAINAAFTPSPDELHWARAVVEVFEANPNMGSLPLNGRMVDRSHFTVARRTIGMFEREGRASEDPRRQPILRPA